MATRHKGTFIGKDPVPDRPFSLRCFVCDTDIQICNSVKGKKLVGMGKIEDVDKYGELITKYFPKWKTGRACQQCKNTVEILHDEYNEW